MTYDKNGRMLTWTYGDLHILHVYDDKTGYLTEKKIGTRAVYRYIYKSGTKVGVATTQFQPNESTSYKLSFEKRLIIHCSRQT